MISLVFVVLNFVIILILFLLRNRISKHYFATYFIFTTVFLFWRLIKTRFHIQAEDFLEWILFLNFVYYMFSFFTKRKTTLGLEIKSFFNEIEKLWLSYLMELHYHKIYQYTLENAVGKFVLSIRENNKITYVLLFLFLFLPAIITFFSLSYEIFVMNQIKTTLYCFIWSTFFYKGLKNFFILSYQLSWATTKRLAREHDFSYFDRDLLNYKVMQILMERENSVNKKIYFGSYLIFRDSLFIGYKIHFLISRLSEIRVVFFACFSAIYFLMYCFFVFKTIFIVKFFIIDGLFYCLVFLIYKIFLVFAIKDYKELKIIVFKRKFEHLVKTTFKLIKIS